MTRRKLIGPGVVAILLVSALAFVAARPSVTDPSAEMASVVEVSAAATGAASAAGASGSAEAAGAGTSAAATFAPGAAGGSGSRSTVRTWRVRPASVRTRAPGMTPAVSFSMTAASPA